MIEKVVARRDRRKHFADLFGGLSFIASTGGRGTDHGLFGITCHRISHPANARYFNSSMACSTARSGTSVTTSTLPISRGRMKWVTPCTVFLSPLMRFAVRRALTSIFGKGARARIDEMMRCAVAESV